MWLTFSDFFILIFFTENENTVYVLEHGDIHIFIMTEFVDLAWHCVNLKIKHHQIFCCETLRDIFH